MVQAKAVRAKAVSDGETHTLGEREIDAHNAGEMGGGVAGGGVERERPYALTGRAAWRTASGERLAAGVSRRSRLWLGHSYSRPSKWSQACNGERSNAEGTTFRPPAAMFLVSEP